MGVRIVDIIPDEAVEKINISALSGRAIALDAYNILYQFLSTIRGVDGRPLMDRRGRITSHLSGLFFRTINLLSEGVKPVFVFDGRPPELKYETLEKRSLVRTDARRQYAEAIRLGDLEKARRMAQRAASLEQYMVDSSVELLKRMRVPYVMAPSEGEAQAAYMALKGDVYASGSQDMDSLLFGSPRLVRNLSIVGRRKLPGKKVYVEVQPEIIYLDRVLAGLGISREQLIDIGLLVGTDYSPSIEGVGPKTALKLVQEHGSIENAAEKGVIQIVFDYKSVRELFKNPKVTDSYRLEWGEVDTEAVVAMLCGEYDFSEERVVKALDILRGRKSRAGGTLDAFLS
ncbi:MAG: flap endonuclease-1 [Nitrososphaerota archaeon]